MNPQTNGATSRDWLEARSGMKIIAYVETETATDTPEFDLYACGVSPSLALMKLKAEIVSTYERLVELGPKQLGSLLLHCFEAMRAVIEVSGEQKESLHD